MKLNIGDTFRLPDWKDTYEVVGIDPIGGYNVRKIRGDGVIYYHYLLDESFLWIINEGKEGYKQLSPIERKIALMERRFKKRQDEKQAMSKV